ncbi:MAG: YicC family protein [Clostridia bacterium]|nr:YicC family protein [Clostridia bacterium]
MIRSMTSFGRATLQGEQYDLVAELRSVNNRYFECSVRLPRHYSGLEERVKPYLQSRGISRGKVDLSVSATKTASAQALPINDAALRAYLDALYRLRDEYGLQDDISVMHVASNPAVFAPEQEVQTDLDALWEELLPVIAEATDRFLCGRDSEGARLAADLRGKLAHLRELADRIEALSEINSRAYRQKLEERLRTVLEDKSITVDENRILTECAVFADKIAIDEEMVRLRSHFALFEEILDGNEPAGRKLDFLLQEMNREVNTTGSKSCDSTIAHLVVDAKNELEKIREQVQNLE